VVLALTVVLALANTATLVARAPQTQCLMDPANMSMQKGASAALHAMAPGSSKQDSSSRQEDNEAEFMQRVIAEHDSDAQQPNQFADEEYRHVDDAVQETGNSGEVLLVWSDWML
jgi:hypothetical protein